MASLELATPIRSNSTSSATLDLARQRQFASRSLEEIAANTKISLRFLKAIEKEEFDKLPGGIFSTSYLRQYAEAIGYDGEALVAHYRLKMNLPAATGKEPPEKVGQKRLDRWLRIPLQTFR